MQTHNSITLPNGQNKASKNIIIYPSALGTKHSSGISVVKLSHLELISVGSTLKTHLSPSGAMYHLIGLPTYGNVFDFYFVYYYSK
jgi:hypothetical protein